MVPDRERGGRSAALLLGLVWIFAGAAARGWCLDQDAARRDADLEARVQASPTLPFHGVSFAVQAPAAGWVSGAVSGVAVDRAGRIYELQRGTGSEPILVLDRAGQVLRMWGRGDFTIPHSIRLDARGHVWVVDAGSSDVLEYTAGGKRLMRIHVGGQPANGSAFRGATDVGFGPGGSIFVTDGYGNARVLEYTAGGARVRQWGRPGRRGGEFDLPHAIQVVDRVIYVADRENGRLQAFDLRGRFLGEIDGLGRVYAFDVVGDVIWVSMGPLDREPGSEGGWVVTVDRRTGKILGHLAVRGARGGHALALMPSGEPLITLGDALLWFQAN